MLQENSLINNTSSMFELNQLLEKQQQQDSQKNKIFIENPNSVDSNASAVIDGKFIFLI